MDFHGVHPCIYIYLIIDQVCQVLAGFHGRGAGRGEQIERDSL